jgi:predicted O-linked N-acetylglucosamine transferase (SPINDLY family)
LAQRIEDDGIDILLDLTGHGERHRMAVFGQRAAPVQASLLAYPGTTGVPNMDWIVADPVLAPEGSEVLFSERVQRLPHALHCFVPEQNVPYPDYTSVHAERPFTFGCFSDALKFTPRTLGLWARVLQANPGARLLLKAESFKDAGAVCVLTQRFAALGVAAQRLVFRGPSPLDQTMAEYAEVDIALDTVPFNGGISTLQALWMGVPVVVLAGGSFASRMGASALHGAGLSDWVADSDDDYVRLATEKAQDRPALLALKQGLRAHLQTTPAWQIDTYARDLEAALLNMWQDHCADKTLTRWRKPKSAMV